MIMPVLLVAVTAHVEPDSSLGNTAQPVCILQDSPKGFP